MLDIVDGKVVRKAQRRPVDDARRRSRALAPPAAARMREPGLSAEGWFHRPHELSLWRAHRGGAVDRDTGGVTVERYLVAYDVGRAVNPMLVEGQIVGGVAQGLGGALLRGIPLRRARRAAVGQLSPTT